MGFVATELASTVAPNKGGLEVSKKVQYNFVAKRAAKFCFVKLHEILF